MGTMRNPIPRYLECQLAIALLDNIVVRSDGCWQWTGKYMRGGRGFIYLKGVNDYREGIKHEGFGAPHVSWWLHNKHKQVPDDKHVLHTCHNPRCVNPKHLYLGTHQDNMRDRDEAGRNTKGRTLEGTVKWYAAIQVKQQPKIWRRI
jgi:hypothetical protein